MLKLRDLASKPDFEIGPLSVSPSTRRVHGPAGEAQLEPLIMQVFLLLIESAGRVLTRDELFDQVWGGVPVGDDSLNRAIAKVRRIGNDVAPGLFEVETIPRTGYRLTGPIMAKLDRDAADRGGADRHPRFSRRTSLALGGSAAAALAAGGLWLLGDRQDRRFDALMARGDAAFRDGSAFESGSIGSNNSPTMIRLYREAVRLNPDSARAWGLLAYFLSSGVDELSSSDAPRAIEAAQYAIQQALSLDPKEPNARVALFLLQGSMFSWIVRDRQLRAILDADPQNIPAMMELMPLLQAAGLTRESWGWNERVLKASPFFRACLVVRAFKLWIVGRVGEADDVINRVVGLWPDYRFGNYCRFTIFALTGRPRAARADLGHLEPSGRQTRAIVLDALETRSSAAIEAARSACVETAQRSPPLANDTIMYLCALGLVDTAFELTEGYLLWRGKFVSQNPANRREADAYNRRMTQWLFTPPVAPMRADPRFAKLCDEFGLTAYWRARNVKPDYLAYG